MKLKWTDLADSDLDKIEANIAKDNSPVTAINVVTKVIDTIQLILPKHPGAGRQGRVRGTRELVIDGLPFIVIYRDNAAANCIEILRVLHHAQYWPD